ncbi:MAG: DNA polymerase III subunit alpha [Bacilli bacterium]|nr:DNA polymerase III subunit alpha [Bacilli bacterium]
MINYDLFIQSGYSFNGSIIDPDKIAKLAAEKGFSALGLADSGKMYAAVKFYLACKQNGIKPIIGLNINAKTEGYRHIPLLFYAKNEIGYANLVKISSLASQTKEWIDLAILVEFSEGLAVVALTTEGDIYRSIASGDLALANQIIMMLDNQFADFYLGLDLNDFFVETKIAPELESLHRCIIVNQVLYYEDSDIDVSSVLKALLGEGKEIDKGILDRGETSYHLKTSEELDRIYQEYPIANENTLKLIESVNFDFSFDKLFLPRYPVPNDYRAKDYLRALATKGLDRRLAAKPSVHNREEYRMRLIHELRIIESMGYEDYFLIVWDFVLYAKKSGILVGPGRGSAAGSLVAYVLGIVDVDPLEHALFFERFLNPERITMPDIDMDFPDDRRDEVIRYVVDKYGKDHVANIVAFGTFQGKSALRDVARVLNTKDLIVDEITKYVGETDNSIAEFEKDQPDKYAHLIEIPEVKRLFDVAKKIVDLPRHISTHAAGIIITEQVMSDMVPIQPGLMDMFQTQYEALDLESLGLLKIDFLGIRNLTTIDKVIDLIAEKTDTTVDIYKIPFDDKKTYQLLCDVKTLGIFQLESKGMMSLLRQMQIREFADISTCIALFRPGPMENIPSYIRRRNHQEPVTYPHPDLERILSGTQGIIVYQEQIMQIANEFAGYSLGEADVLRRAVSKKKEAILIEERYKFVSKCKERGHSEVLSNQIYDYIVKFANYGFNKSHSVAYSVVAYWMAYLKANYPGYFMAVLMDSAVGSQTATQLYIGECRDLGIRILPPRINRSGKSYRLEETGLRYPYLGIRNIGSVVAERIDQIQAQGEINSFIDFVYRAKDLNVRVIESLIMVGVFDDFGETKQTLIENLRQIIISLNMAQKPEDIGFVYIKYPEYPEEYLLAQEKELIGFNLSYHPLAKFAERNHENGLKLLSSVELKERSETNFVALLKRVKVIKTKNGEEMAFLELEDMYQRVDAVLFPATYRQFGKNLSSDMILHIVGHVEIRNTKTQIVIDNLKEIKEE